MLSRFVSTSSRSNINLTRVTLFTERLDVPFIATMGIQCPTGLVLGCQVGVNCPRRADILPCSDVCLPLARLFALGFHTIATTVLPRHLSGTPLTCQFHIDIYYTFEDRKSK